MGAHKTCNLGAQLRKAAARYARGQMDIRKRGWAFLGRGAGLLDERSLVPARDLDGLGEHELKGYSAVIEEREHLLIGLGDAVARVDQDEDAREARPAPEIGLEQSLP